MAVTPPSEGVAAPPKNPRQHRKARRCRLEIEIGMTKVDGLCDTGAAGGNCLDQSVFNALPPERYRITSYQSSVCVGINKQPIRVLGKIMLDFQLRSIKGVHPKNKMEI